MLSTGSTPAASTNNYIIINMLQTKSAGKAKNIAIAKSFPISKIDSLTLKPDEPASEKYK
jgi:hypothetical protein